MAKFFRTVGSVHLNLAKVLMTVVGTWPLNITGYTLKLYNAYFYIPYTYYILYNCTMAAMIYKYFSEGRLLEAATNLNVFILVIYVYRISICKSPTIKTLIEEIGGRENLILTSKDVKIKDIYKKHVRSAFVSMLFYICVGSSGSVTYFIRPLVKNALERTNDNPEKHKYLIFSSWFPFDTDSHYPIAYLVQLLGGFIGYIYTIHPGAFFVCILKFIIGQIKILQHIFRNFRDYIYRYSKENGLSVEESQKALTKLCIREHQYLISLVERFNNSISTFMFMEYLISSFQLSLVAYQILQCDGGFTEKAGAFLYLLTLSVQLFLFYWNAHDMIAQSTEISQAVYESDWYTLDVGVQKMLIPLIQRAQKPLAISGPMYKARLESLIAIFKAIYSYIALIRSQE